MSNINLKGKKSKILSTDIYEFSLDSFRSSFSTQDENLNIQLIDGVSIDNVRETLNSQDLTINGSLNISARGEIIRNIKSAFTNVQNNTYNHLNIAYNKHYEEKIDPDLPLNSQLAKINKLTFGVDFEYNNFIKKYEDFLMENKKIPEINLPNFYDIIDKYIVSNASILKIERDEFLLTPEKVIFDNVLESQFESITYDSFLRTSLAERGVEEKFLNFDEYLKKYNFLSIQFPFNTRIKISKELKEQNNFSSILHVNGVYRQFLDFVINNNTENILIQKDLNNRINNKNIKECLLAEQFKNIFNATYGNNQINFYNELQSIAINKVNNFSNILSGKEDYVEAIGYKIEKYTTNGQEVPRLIQEFYIPNIFDQTTEFIDTQIFVNKNYLYKLKVLLLTFKYNYKYTNISEINGSIKLEYNYSPFGVIYELDSSEFSDSLANHKLLPINPDVEFVPYIGIPNKIKINITPGNGEKIAKIQYIDENEIDKIPNLRIMQQISMVPVGSDKLKYASYLPIKKYEIYRTIEKPRNYSDFRSFLLKTIDVKDSYAVSFEDGINSNTKYYYTFRSIDYQESVSLPSEIYEFELINDNGTIIPNINIINLNDTSGLKTDTKLMRAFLKIQPAVAQKVLQNINNNGVKLGINKESVWGKDFKIRIKSRQTGKILDFNIKFTYNKKS